MMVFRAVYEMGSEREVWIPPFLTLLLKKNGESLNICGLVSFRKLHPQVVELWFKNLTTLLPNGLVNGQQI